MRPWGLVACVVALLTSAGVIAGHAADPFDQTLSRDEQAVHVLNRLAYGPRPGEVEAVRRLGVTRWIRQQLRPERIPEHPRLAARLAPLTTVTMRPWQVFEAFAQPQPVIPAPAPLQTLLTPAQLNALLTGTAAERRTVLDTLPPDLRRNVLAQAPSSLLQVLPELRDEAQKAAQARNTAQQQEYQRQMRLIRPPLNELLTADEQNRLHNGSEDEKTEVLARLAPEQRTLVLRSLPAQRVPSAFRREALGVTQPQQLMWRDLVDARIVRAVYSERQLEEVLVDFWINHFNVFSGKDRVQTLLPGYERDAIRPHVFGRFSDMLLATARHPAMLLYLDNWQSRGPTHASDGRRHPGLNEN